MNPEDQDAAFIREALDLGLQAWRTTPARDKFFRAFNAITRLERVATAARGYLENEGMGTAMRRYDLDRALNPHEDEPAA